MSSLKDEWTNKGKYERIIQDSVIEKGLNLLAMEGGHTSGKCIFQLFFYICISFLWYSTWNYQYIGFVGCRWCILFTWATSPADKRKKLERNAYIMNAVNNFPILPTPSLTMEVLSSPLYGLSLNSLNAQSQQVLNNIYQNVPALAPEVWTRLTSSPRKHCSPCTPLPVASDPPPWPSMYPQHSAGPPHISPLDSLP